MDTKSMEWQNIQLARNFSLWELCRSERFPHLVEPPSGIILHWLTWWARDALQPLRDVVGPLIITSGYRSARLNEAVGGVSNSIHRISIRGRIVGVASDGYAREMPADDVLRIIARMKHLPIRGIIIYPHENRLHIDSREGPRRFFECRLVKTRDGRTVKVYPEIPSAAIANYRMKG